MKPHIRMINGWWICTGSGFDMPGASPAFAYGHWRGERARRGGMSITLNEFLYMVNSRRA